MALLLGSLFLNFTVDDAFITFRYGKTLVENGHWAWNPTGSFAPVEAYTNPLFAFLSIVPHALSLPLIPFFKILGIIALCFVFHISLRGVNDRSRLLVATIVCANFYIFAHAFSCLETIYFLAAALYTLDESERNPAANQLTLLIFIAPLIRPEGAVLSAYIATRQWRNPASRKLILGCLLAACAYPIFRYFFFGKILPNTFYVKMVDADIVENIKEERWIILLSVAALLTLKASATNITLPVLLCLSYFGANLTSDMQMNYGHRFAYHLIVPVAIHASKQAIKLKTKVFPVFYLSLLACSLSTLSIASIKHLLDYYPNLLNAHGRLADSLHRLPRSTVIAVGDAGIIPYRSDLPSIDFIGLASAEIAAKLRGTSDVQLPRPDLIVVYSNDPGNCDNYHVSFRGLLFLREKFNTSQEYICVSGPPVGHGLLFEWFDLEGIPLAHGAYRLVA